MCHGAATRRKDECAREEMHLQEMAEVAGEK